MFLLTMAVPGDAAIVQDGAVLRLQPSFGLVYCLVALVVALSAALVFVLFRREPPGAHSGSVEVSTISRSHAGYAG
jgi:hypothetical protein